jgi:hypothetical protein
MSAPPAPLPRPGIEPTGGSVNPLQPAAAILAAQRTAVKGGAERAEAGGLLGRVEEDLSDGNRACIPSSTVHSIIHISLPPSPGT